MKVKSNVLQRTLIAVLALVMTLSLIPIIPSAYAADENAVENSDPFTITYDANGGQFADGSTENKVSYTIGEREVTKYSHTDNWTNNGEKKEDSLRTIYKTDVISIPGASSLTVEIRSNVNNFSSSRDVVCLWNGDQKTYNVNDNWKTSISGKIINDNEEYKIDGDTVTISCFCSRRMSEN